MTSLLERANAVTDGAEETAVSLGEAHSTTSAALALSSDAGDGRPRVSLALGPVCPPGRQASLTVSGGASPGGSHQGSPPGRALIPPAPPDHFGGAA